MVWFLKIPFIKASTKMSVVFHKLIFADLCLSTNKRNYILCQIKIFTLTLVWNWIVCAFRLIELTWYFLTKKEM
jgi:hypothetical protein